MAFFIGSIRHLSVKELPWCAPTDSPVRRRRPPRQQQQQQEHRDGIPGNVPNPAAAATKTNHGGGNANANDLETNTSSTPIDKFGVVAAVCRPSNSNKNTHTMSMSMSTSSSGIIGVNGKLPWGFLPSDRAIFERLTRNHILIVGRRTLLNERNGNLDHVRHAGYCIVVSKSMSMSKSKSMEEIPTHGLKLRLARSLDHALDIARVLAIQIEADGKNEDKTDPTINSCPASIDRAAPKNCDGNTRHKDGIDIDIDTDTDIDIDIDTDIESMIPASSDTIRCWVAGGEKLYEEALKHESALELHLSIVDKEIDLNSTAVKHVARFPAKYRWDHNYQHVAETPVPANAFPPNTETTTKQGALTTQTKTEPSFVYHVYKRIVRNIS
eukprot:CAMPEP_0168214206 /NCGR_PEP_ID=MMETSP0140_2-20121125/5225_1 /TAXON_ID=44445 /ORGANISM="Pseudo-nitzschia australis, Strain 10249 10 AB" /LENGTH=382 /DNA_ID=CAMNT_0008141149 /DNA_START=245 /DNA_END=1394 /DNA_ORIENTATION=+